MQQCDQLVTSKITALFQALQNFSSHFVQSFCLFLSNKELNSLIFQPCLEVSGFRKNQRIDQMNPLILVFGSQQLSGLKQWFGPNSLIQKMLGGAFSVGGLSCVQLKDKRLIQTAIYQTVHSKQLTQSAIKTANRQLPNQGPMNIL